MENIIGTVQNNYNELGKNLEGLTRKLIGLIVIEEKQRKIIQDYREKIILQNNKISMLKKAADCDAVDKNTQENLINEKNLTEASEKIEITENQLKPEIIEKFCETYENKLRDSDVINKNNQVKIPDDSTKTQVSINLKRKPEIDKRNLKQVKKPQQTMDIYLKSAPNPRKENSGPPSKEIISKSKCLSNEKSESKQKALVTTIVDEEGFRIIKKNKERIEEKLSSDLKNIGIEITDNQPNYTQSEIEEISKCNECREIYRNLGNVLTRHEVKSMCAKHSSESEMSKVPDFYYN